MNMLARTSVALVALAAAAITGPVVAETRDASPRQVAGDMDAAARRAAAIELADLMERYYLFPDVARQYGAHLRALAAEGRFDALGTLPEFAASLQAELRGVHEDAHLRVTPVSAEGDSMTRVQRRVGEALQGASWIGDGVAYLAIGMLPGDEATERQMAAFLDEYDGARALVLDLRRCPGGGLNVMDVLFSRLFPERTHLLTMDMRAGANRGLEGAFESLPTLERVEAPAGTIRWHHVATPAATPGAWPDARVYVLTDVTASACEHLTLALKRTGRATIVGRTTRGAGHFGGDRQFAGGRLSVFLPVGRTYDPVTNDDWEGDGVAPTVAVDPREALDFVARDLGTPLDAVAAGPAVRSVEVNPPNRRYGIGLVPPRAGDAAIDVVRVESGSIAAGAGLKAGDRIVSLNGSPVAAIQPSDLPTYMRASPLVVVVDRGGETLSFTLSFGG